MDAGLLSLALAAAALAGTILADRFEPATSPITKAILAAIVGGMAFVLAPSGYDTAFVGWSMALTFGFTALAVIDLRSKTVPDVLSVPLVILGLVHAWMRGLPIVTMGVTVAIIVGAAFVMSLIPSRLRMGIGGGDALLLAAALAWIGPMVAIDLILLTASALIPFFAWQLYHSDEDTGVAAAPAFGIATLILWLNGPVF